MFIPKWCVCVIPCVLLSQDGITALYAASQEGHLPVVEALLEANAAVNQQTKVLT